MRWGGLEPPNPWWIRFRPYPGNWWTLDEFRLNYMGRFDPLHSGLGFRLIGNGSLLLLLVHLCLGDDHMTSHLASLPQIRLCRSPATVRRGGRRGDCRPASLALLLDYIMSKFPAASKPLAQPSNRLPDENSSDHGRDSSAGLLQPDEEEGDEENSRPASLALLLDCIMSKFPVAPKPLAQPSTRRFHVFGAAVFVQESSQRSSNLSWFDHVQFACASTQSKFETRIYEGKSLSSIMPSVSKVMKVSHSPCQEWELEVNSQLYDLMSSKPSDTRSVPMSVRDAAVLERTLRNAL